MLKTKLDINTFVVLKKQGYKNSTIAKQYKVSHPYVSKLQRLAIKQGFNLEFDPVIPPGHKIDSIILNEAMQGMSKSINSSNSFDFNTEAKRFIQGVLIKRHWNDERAQVQLATYLMDLAKGNQVDEGK